VQASSDQVPAPRAPVVLARVAWAGLAVAAWTPITQALEGRSRPVEVTVAVGAWVLWAIVALALLVPSTVALTAARVAAPVCVAGVVTVVAIGRDDVSPGWSAAAIALAAAASAACATAEFGEAFAQASAYGDERRFVLRPPVALLVPLVVSWTALCACVLVGPVSLAAGDLLVGVPVTAAAAALVWLLPKRFHRLSRRWIVVVPAGVVVHDHVVLAETAMFSRGDVTSVGLALAGTQAADLTGPAAGHAIEVALAAPATVVLAPTRAQPRGVALHVRSVLVAPSRPGRVLRETGRRRLPTG